MWVIRLVASKTMKIDYAWMAQRTHTDKDINYRK